MRRTRGPLLTAGVAALVAGTVTATAGPAAAAPPTPQAAATEKVIVVLADQLSAAPPDRSHISVRAMRAHQAQQDVLARLSGPAPTNVKKYTVGNAFAATVTVAQADALAADPAVASVVVDRDVAIRPAVTHTNTPSEPPNPAPSAVNPAACSSDPNHPLLEPEALQTINARSDDPNAKTAAALGIDGSGVKVAYIADGINPNNPGFIRSNDQSAIVDYKDFYGDGPDAPTGGAEAFGDASSVAAQGNVTYDIANDYANPNAVSFPGGHCYIRVVGVAPGADIVALKAGSELLPNSAILQAIDYAVTTDHVDVLNESFGANIYPDSGTRNTIELFDDMAVKAGTTVTVSSGDSGTTSTIGNPATDPNVISTGATTDSRIYEQTGYALATAFGNGTWQNDEISSLSSSGITQNGRTIDVSAAGESDWALCDTSGNFSNCYGWNGKYDPIQPFGGTSQSAPMTAGVAALVIQAYRKTHNGASPSPMLVKTIITSTAHDLGFAGDVQGTGRIDARAAVEAALTWPGGSNIPDGTSNNIALSTDQLKLEGAPGSTQTGTVQVTNVGTSDMTVLPSTRSYASLGETQQNVTLDPNSDPTTPYPTNGAPWIYQTAHFTVPGGTDVLDTSIRWVTNTPPATPGPVVRLSLFAPDGSYVANTRPQGGNTYPANYGDALVRQPMAGQWTAVLYTAQSGGYAGNVVLRTDPQRALPSGQSSGIVTIKPGKSAPVSVTVGVPAVGGDGVDTLVLSTSAGRQVAVPVILRALVPTGNGPGTFTGTISGGNARPYAPAQTFSYEFDVPQGKRDLDVSVLLANDPGDLLEGILVDPNGETPSVGTNAVLDAPQGRGMSNFVANPQPGRWRYVVVVENPVTGNAFFQNFTGHIAFNQVRIHSTLPTNQDVIPANGFRNYTVQVSNPGPEAIAVQADARTNGLQTVQLAPQFGKSTIQLPLSIDNLANVPNFLIPPDTQRVALSAASSVPAQVELQSPGGGIDLFGDLQAAKNGNTVSTATVSERRPAHVGQGFWFTYVQEIGPFDDNGAPAGQSTLVGRAVTNGFDRSVTSPVGDTYLASVDPTASDANGQPLIVPPFSTMAFTVRVKPQPGAHGVQSGLLNVVTTPIIAGGLFATTGDVVATLPYSYRVK